MNLIYLSLMMKALDTDIGIVIRTEDPSKLRQKLYAIRREDSTFANLAFVLTPDAPTELWILKKDPNG
jgi:hypothetical protein